MSSCIWDIVCILWYQIFDGISIWNVSCKVFYVNPVVIYKHICIQIFVQEVDTYNRCSDAYTSNQGK